MSKNILNRLFFAWLAPLMLSLLTQNLYAETRDAKTTAADTIESACTEIILNDAINLRYSVHTGEDPHNTNGFIATDTTYANTGSTCLTFINASRAPFPFSISIENPRLNHVELLKKDNNLTYPIGIAGIDYPLENWQQYGGEILFNLEIPPHNQQTYHLNMGSISTFNSLMFVTSTDNLLKKLQLQQTITGLLIGIILSLIVYALFLAISGKQKIYILLAGSATGVTLLQLSDLGALYPLWPKSIYWNQVCSPFFAIVSTAFGCKLAREYLFTVENMPRTDKGLSYYFWYLILFSLPLSLTNNFTLIIALYGIPTLGMMIALVTTSIIRIRQGYTPAKLYLIALIFPVISGFAIFLTTVGALPASPLSRLLPLAGTAIQLILFAVALGERINWLKQENDREYIESLLAKTETAAKKNFLAHISHELRTPLAGIIGLAELAKKKILYETQQPLIDGLEDSAKLLLNTTTMLLDHARLDAGKWTINSRDFNPRALLEKIIWQYKLEADKKNISLNMHIHPDVPDSVSSDPDIFDNIVRHIIHNSIISTANGGILVVVESSVINGKQVVIRIDSIDTGGGINDLSRSKIFELFELADSSTTREQQGTGMGLSLSQKLCHLLGGEIGCDSNSQQGSVLWCTIPCVLSKTQPAPASRVDFPQATFRQGRKILVAEDDETLQLVISAQLEKLKQEHSVFPNGKLLVEEYKHAHQNIKLLLLDWNMPVCNASEAIKAIRQYENSRQLPPVPICIMSAYDKQSTKELHIAPDIKTLQKPLSTDDLQHIITTSSLIT